MSVNIAHYLTEVEKVVADALKETRKRTGREDVIDEKEWLEIVLPKLDVLGGTLAAQLSIDILEKKGVTWSSGGTEMRLLSLGLLLLSWGRWVFKSKSENPKYPLRQQAAVIEKQIESLVKDVLVAAERLGADGRRPEGRHEFIEID